MSQNETVRKHLLTVGPITPLDAMRLYNIWRLGARIYDLHTMYGEAAVRVEMVKQNGKRFARYHAGKGLQRKTPRTLATEGRGV